MREKILLLCVILAPHFGAAAAPLAASEGGKETASVSETMYTKSPLYMFQRDGTLVPVQFGEGIQLYRDPRGGAVVASTPEYWPRSDPPIIELLNLQREAINELKEQLDEMKQVLESYKMLDVRVKALELGAK